MTKLRLLITLLSNYPQKDSVVWESIIGRLSNEYTSLMQSFYIEQKDPTRYDDGLESDFYTGRLDIPPGGYEDMITECLLCGVDRTLDSFSLCGHGTCLFCQVEMGEVQCQFCSEHFSTPLMDTTAIKMILRNPSTGAFKNKIETIKEEKAKRQFAFDFSSGHFRLPVHRESL